LSIIKQTKSTTVWDCDLVPKYLVIDRYFLAEKQTIEKLEAEKEAVANQLTELEEEHYTEDGYFAELDKVNKASINGQLKIDNVQLKKHCKNSEEYVLLKAKIEVFEQYLKLLDNQTELNKKIKEAQTELDKKVIERYKTLTEEEIKQLVVDDKWMANIERSVKTEMERISQRLTQRIKELAERYETPLPKQTNEVKLLEERVNKHLEMMGFSM
jgi:type I restriction enzyme M protein